MIAVQELRKKIAGKKRLQMSINFEFGRSDLPFDSIAKFEPAALLLKQRLDEKIRLLKQSPNIKIQIEGHTDDIGTPEYNMTLGQERAETVKAYLLEKGVPAKMIVKTLSKAATEPLVPNSDEENRQKNRRVEIVVVE
ncbi:hypothetical protein AGMMS49982_21070 [Bacteroidia bacterium]|nr:hypothetical protein AGMMS49982_21070 [Bacteroidia bacterium]